MPVVVLLINQGVYLTPLIFSLAFSSQRSATLPEDTKSTLFLMYPMLMAYFHIGLSAALSIGCRELFPLACVIIFTNLKIRCKTQLSQNFAYLFKSTDDLVKYCPFHWYSIHLAVNGVFLSLE